MPVLTMASIRAAGRALAAPFAVRLQIADRAGRRPLTITVVEMLRLLPGRRVVARVEWDGEAALLKLFLGRRARRYCRREAAGCARLVRAGVPTPALLGTVEDDDGRSGCGLLFEYLAGARPVTADETGAIAEAAGWLGRLHQAGCRHRDLHLDNLLTTATGARVLIDGDPVRRWPWPWPVTAAAGLRNLAVLCAQRPPLADDALPAVFQAYAAARGWRDRASPAGVERLRRATARQRQARLRRYLRKTLRPCSEFHSERTLRRFLTARRDVWPDLAALAADPEATFRGAQLLKDGNSATVVRARLGDAGGRTCVIKRYNVKGPWHRLRRAVKPGARFRLAWLNGHRLWMLGVPTARPLLLLERRLGPLHGVAYLVMEDLGDRHLGQEIDEQGLGDERMAELVRLFRTLQAAGLRHGDTKITNLLVTEAGAALIDLDAMAPSRRGQRRDVARFLANFEHQPMLRDRVAAALAAAGVEGAG
ncbi:MAG: lipopolysaccharide kinase InaA family protein [Pseudomonadales bacterium]